MRARVLAAFGVVIAAIMLTRTVSAQPIGENLYLYVQQPSGSLASYRIGRDGALTLTGHIDPVWPAQVKHHYAVAVRLAVQPGGRFAYSTPLVPSLSDREQDRLQKYRIDKETGSLVQEGAAEPLNQSFGALLFSMMYTDPLAVIVNRRK